jgi:hypothetical protein
VCYNPAILQIGAIHFDIENGKPLRFLNIFINLESSRQHGLVEEKRSLDWLAINIPDTLQKSRDSKITLPQALKTLTIWVNTCHQKNIGTLFGKARYESQVMVWGNGIAADNVWIHSAYKACGIERPWKYYNDM